MGPSKKKIIVGVDEVGRGSLFGPVFAGAVVLNQSATKKLIAKGLTDSKALSNKRRGELVPLIKAFSSDWGLGQASAKEIDDLGIRLATETAMLRALQRLRDPFSLVIVDGVLPIRIWEGPQQTLVKGDKKCAAISAASILAKEARDALIKRLSNKFQGYGLENHVGYGTSFHRKALLAIGASKLHRQTFLKNIFNA